MGTPAEQWLARVLKILAAALALLALLNLCAPFVWRDSDFFVTPPFWVTNTTAGIALLAFLAWVSAADVRRYRMMIWVLIGGFLIAAVSALALLAHPIGQLYATPLAILGVTAFVLALLVIVLLVSAAPAAAAWSPWISERPLGTWEQAGRVIFGLFGLFSLGGTVLSVAAPYLGNPMLDALFNQPLYIVGSAVKLGLLGLFGLFLAVDVRRYSHQSQMFSALIFGNAASFVVIIVVSLLGLSRFGDYAITIGGTTLNTSLLILGALLLDAGVIGGFTGLMNQLNHSVLDFLGFLSATQFRALEAGAETLVSGGDLEIVPPHKIAQRTDYYLANFASDRLVLARLAVMGLQLAPLVWLMPPLTYLNPAKRQDFINTRFKKDVLNPPLGYRILDGIVLGVNGLLLLARGRSLNELGAALSFIGLLEGMLRFNMQLTVMGFYSDPAVWSGDQARPGIGYVPFSQRPKGFDVKPLRPHPPLEVLTPRDLIFHGIDTIRDADVVIIGSGAAGSILAEQLVEQGRRVLLLERGLYVKPDDFSEDEIDMISRLYRDGALQISQSLRFTILQGSCVGGTTVVNNAVCFDTPERVVDAWNSRGSQAVIDKTAFYESQAAVRKRLRIGKIQPGTRQPLEGGVLNHGDEGAFNDAVQRYFADRAEDYRYDVIEANIVDCLGCGYCNIGCKYGRKLSMLDEVLPAAQARHGAENLSIISEAEVVQLVTDNGHVTEIQARVQGKRHLSIKNPKTVIVCAGTIASSWLLMQSGIGKGKLPVGRRLSFNMGSPLHGWFGRKLNSYDGLQIAHYLAIGGREGYVYETWYNPPVAQAMAMPGWLDTHFANMRHYDEMAALGVLVGTEPTAYLTPALLTRGPDVVYQPTAADLGKVVEALVTAGEIMFAGGAREVYVSTRSYRSYVNEQAVFSAQSELDRLRDLVTHDYDILLGTGHPQGGNAIGVNGTLDAASGSVIGPDFKVFGYDNLYVCDASVFPSATTVNPQLTVMTMAHYAAGRIQ